MTTLPRWMVVTESDEGLTVTRRIPPLEHWLMGLSLVAVGALCALDPGFTLADFCALALAVTVTSLTLPGRAQAIAHSSVVKQLRRRLVVATGVAASGYREAGKVATVVIDGRERPRADLRRVVVGREITIVFRRDGSTVDVPHAGTVALIFDDEVVVVDRATTVDAAAALAERIAAAAGLEVGWLADVATSLKTANDLGASGVRHQLDDVVSGMFSAMQQAAQPRQATPRYGEHLSTPRRAGAFFFAAAVVLVWVTWIVNLGCADFALTPSGRWATSLAATAVWAVADTAALYGVVAIVRAAAVSRAREVYGLDASRESAVSLRRLDGV